MRALRGPFHFEDEVHQALGPSGPMLASEIGLTMKLHAVAPGGPPEGHVQEEAEVGLSHDL
jgi:hypothetical protein